ncbi:MAG: S-layer homology domain-containing protein [Megasphaera sp.]|uniref:S-layer homology domain-containing protein n=1 Tax=Megasphaera sp. TaxID=2023260 RepID=UPI0025B93E8B|nr:S-layer homology domain-containing protein [Megasphaera sp.]MBS7223155.1 S-layer homology domain-containing protein [Megasphaera sp.]
MKKKIVTSLAAMMAVGAACAFAANPFVDVPSDSWAYKSVVELADAGIIQGVDGSYFQGERNITRYEAAEMVAKAMAHMDKASVEQRALINKLADEYADELNNLGVRVSALENRVGNVKLSGDARIRFQHQDTSSEASTGYKKDASWDYRVRVRANAKVNDRTTVTYGISTDDINFADNGAASDNGNIFTDDAKVDYNFGGDHWNLSVGRTDTDILGGENAYGFQYGDVFDRAELKYTNDHFAATAGYGKFKAGDTVEDAAVEGNGLLGVKTGYGELEGFFGGGRAAGSAVGVYYNDFNGINGFKADDLWGAYASLNFGKWNALANYEKINNDVTNDPEVWIGKLTYGSADSDARGSWDAWVEYINSDKGALLGGATNSWRDDSVLDNVKSWGVGIDYTLAKNVILTAAQTFGTQTKHGNAADPDEFTDVEINFLF